MYDIEKEKAKRRKYIFGILMFHYLFHLDYGYCFLYCYIDKKVVTMKESISREIRR
ncbi:MAG: hypothetical protein PHE29_08250 [Tissierellia bacterium]|nr:hypothetical protein [Tissierellia bacterium]MDD4779056.1 hypothetical protein [Tissierellia bacterium]